jgi:hypothetical protein
VNEECYNIKPITCDDIVDDPTPDGCESRECLEVAHNVFVCTHALETRIKSTTKQRADTEPTGPSNVGYTQHYNDPNDSGDYCQENQVCSNYGQECVGAAKRCTGDDVSYTGIKYFDQKLREKLEHIYSF